MLQKLDLRKARRSVLDPPSSQHACPKSGLVDSLVEDDPSNDLHPLHILHGRVLRISPKRNVTREIGIEPMTLRLTVVRYYQLSLWREG